METEGLKKFLPSMIGVIIIMALMYVAPFVGETIGSTTHTYERIETVNVFFNDEGTDATKFTVAIYNEDDQLITDTAEGEILGDSWCSASFVTPVRIEDGKEYSFLVSANGDFSIPGNVESGYIEEGLSSYGNFPYTIDSTGDTGKLSIFAEFL